MAEWVVYKGDILSTNLKIRGAYASCPCSIHEVFDRAMPSPPLADHHDGNLTEWQLDVFNERVTSHLSDEGKQVAIKHNVVLHIYR